MTNPPEQHLGKGVYASTRPDSPVILFKQNADSETTDAIYLSEIQVCALEAWLAQRREKKGKRR